MKSCGECFLQPQLDLIINLYMNMFLLEIVSLVAAIFSLSFELCFCTCARAEYEIEGECCPMCPAGNHVYWHCTEDTSTTCFPCPESTYTDHTNGLIQCLSCSVCDPGKGLRERKSCTSTADVVCEPQEGFYCIDKNKNSCTLAVKHIECRPGEYIIQAGTAYTDTACANCSDGFYSNGTLLACQPHSKCNIKGLIEIKAGTTSTDAECGKSSPVGLVIGVTVVVLLMAVFIVLLIYWIWRRKNKCVSYVTQPQNDLEPIDWDVARLMDEKELSEYIPRYGNRVYAKNWMELNRKEHNKEDKTETD